jgi:hypothetical protein
MVTQSDAQAWTEGLNRFLVAIAPRFGRASQWCPHRHRRTQCVQPNPGCSARCQVAEHCWDPVGHAIVRYGYLFEGLIQARQREV